MPNNAETIPVGSRCCSLDGDADRLIYYYNKAENRQFHMLDGDHIAALFATFVLSHLRDLNLLSAYSFGVIQTAYANGNSTRYFKDKLVC
jgi:phosphoacetylglucosamine mutase